MQLCYKWNFKIFQDILCLLRPEQTESQHNKTNKMTCAPSEDSDRLDMHPVWSDFAVRSMCS